MKNTIGNTARIISINPGIKSPTKLKFTTKRLDDIRPPSKGCTYVYDSEAAGLALRITSTRVKTYVLARRINGQPKRINLGRFESMTLKQARDASMQLNGKIAAGVDIIKERLDARQQGIVMSELFNSWKRSAVTKKLRTWKEDERLWELHINKKIGRKTAAKVTTLDIQKLVDSIGEKHPRTANKVVALLNRVYNQAIKTGLINEQNPVKSADRFPETSRERFLGPNELPDFIGAVMAEKEPWRGYFLILLYTGARRSAVASMRWQDIDIENGTWHVPSWASKNKKPLAVPLVPEASDILKGLKGTTINDWVFPSDKSKTGHIVTPTKPWLRICKRAGLKDLRIHDIRRTVGSWLASNGASNFIISKALGHISPRSAEVYARLDTAPVRNALGSITSEWKHENS